MSCCGPARARGADREPGFGRRALGARADGESPAITEAGREVPKWATMSARIAPARSSFGAGHRANRSGLVLAHGAAATLLHYAAPGRAVGHNDGEKRLLSFSKPG